MHHEKRFARLRTCGRHDPLSVPPAQIGCDRERGRTGTYFSLLENSLAGGVVLQVEYLEQLFQLLFGELAEGGDVAKVVQDLQCGEQPESSCRRST